MSLTSDELLHGYLNGAFPMAEPSGEIYWYAPNPRAIIPIETYKPSKSLRPVLNRNEFEIKINSCFKQVMQECAKPRFPSDQTWISDELIDVYCELYTRGFGCSVEAYKNGELAGGLYGVCIGAAFFGESMFFKLPNASKVAFHYLIEILKKNEFLLLDTQFMNDNVQRYGAIEISKDEYESKLIKALVKKRSFKL